MAATKTARAPVATSDPIAHAQLKRIILQAGNRALKTVVIVEAVLIAVLVAAVYYLATHVPPVRTVGLTSDLRIVPLPALTDATLSNAQITNFAAKAIPETYTFDFVNYKAQLQRAGNEYFTREGFESFAKELNSRGVLSRVKSGKFVLTTVVTSAPTIVAQGSAGDRYVWRIQAPVLLTLQNSERRASEKRLAEIVVVRSAEMTEQSGVGITRFSLTRSEG